jgi:hypothetical protein
MILMSIKEIKRFDTVECTVLYTNSKGSVVMINGLKDNPYVIMYDVFLSAKSLILGSISKISNDLGYVRVKLDSVIDTACIAA